MNHFLGINVLHDRPVRSLVHIHSVTLLHSSWRLMLGSNVHGGTPQLESHIPHLKQQNIHTKKLTKLETQRI